MEAGWVTALSDDIHISGDGELVTRTSDKRGGNIGP